MFPIKWLDESQKCSMSDLCCKDNKLGLHETSKMILKKWKKETPTNDKKSCARKNNRSVKQSDWFFGLTGFLKNIRMRVNVLS